MIRKIMKTKPGQSIRVAVGMRCRVADPSGVLAYSTKRPDQEALRAFRVWKENAHTEDNFTPYP